jgi:hypothetical protein
MENKCKNCSHFKRNGIIYEPQGKTEAVFGTCKLSIDWNYYEGDDDIQLQMKESSVKSFGGDSVVVHEDFGCINFKTNK